MIYLILVLSGILTALSTMVSYLGPLAFFSLAPYLYILIRDTEKGAAKCRRLYLYGLVFSLSYFIAVYHWFWYLYPMEFLGFSPVTAFFVCLFFQVGLSLLQAVPYAFMPIVFRYTRAFGKYVYPIIFGLIWAVFEFLQTLTWAGVPWARLCLSQTLNLPLLNTASLFGSTFVSFIIASLNGYIAIAVSESIRAADRASLFRKLIKPVSFFLAILLVSSIAGTVSMALIPSKGNGDGVEVLLVQTNVGSGDKWDDYYSSFDKAYEMTKSALDENSADIVLWPETTLLFSPRENRSIDAKLTELSVSSGAVLVVGCFEYIGDESYNALVAYFPDGSSEEGGYYKRHLVPFGEYVPMRAFLTSFLPFLEDISMLSDDLSKGEDSAVIKTDFGSLGRLVCFDSIYPTLALDAVRDGATLMLLSTNDSWYLDSASAYQHKIHAQLRAIETGRWYLRCATTGISAIISPDGETESSLAPLKEGYVRGTVYNLEHRTLYSYVGDLFTVAAFTVLALLCSYNLVIFIKRKRSSAI